MQSKNIANVIVFIKLYSIYCCSKTCSEPFNSCGVGNPYKAKIRVGNFKQFVFFRYNLHTETHVSALLLSFFEFTVLLSYGFIKIWYFFADLMGF